LKALKDNRLTQVASGTAAIDIPEMLGFSADGTAIVIDRMEDGVPVWRLFSLKDYSWGAPLDEGTALYSVVLDRKSGRIIGGAGNLDETEYVFFDAELQAHWNAVLRAFPDEAVRLISHTDDFSRMVVEVFGAKHGYVYALFDWYSHQAVVLGEIYDGVPAPAPVTRVAYPAADGLTIDGLLTVPRGAAKDLPLIVLPHGGPESVDTLGFDWWAQALASQGYAVLQPNYRGSSVDAKFVARGFGEFGRKMQTDLSDGVRYLAKQGVIDPQRVCIVGASYGGYAALAGVTLDPGVYRCAVSVAGISDLKRFRGWLGDNKSAASQRYWDRFVGVTEKDDAGMKAISQLDHVGVVAAPVLLIHGRDDTVVPFEQSDLMFSALKRAGKPAQMVTLKHEDHWRSRSETRLQMLQACVDFLKQQNPPNPVPP
jgi:dipeptidyl aminopeptidase/acylaminoacyl peptidase